MSTTSGARGIEGAFAPISQPPLPFASGSAGAAAQLLIADNAGTGVIRRGVLSNTHATQSLTLFFVPRGQGAGAQTTATLGGRVIAAGQTIDLPLWTSEMSALIVGSGAATTFQGFVSDN